VKVSASYYSSQGKRTNNEDSISLLENKDNVLAIVADGLGGYEGGEIASQIAVETINDEISHGKLSVGKVENAIKLANEKVHNQQTNGYKMKTTISVLCIDGDNAVVANVGDSRLYQFRNKMIAFQSVDHSVSQMAVLVGEITTNDIRTHHDRNKLVRALGSRDEVKVDIKRIKCKKGDSFLLCSDGFWEHVLESEMLEDLTVATSVNEWLAIMRKKVETRIRPNGDNHSAIAIFLN